MIFFGKLYIIIFNHFFSLNKFLYFKLRCKTISSFFENFPFINAFHVKISVNIYLSTIRLFL